VLAHVAAFEWRYQLRSPVFWVGCLILFLITFGATTVEQVQIGSIGFVHKNSPYAILYTVSLMGLFGVFTTVALVANAVVRDDETGFAPILRSTSIGKASYLGGRFLGATAAALMIMATVPLAIWVGSLMPWVDPEKIGPNRVGDYLYALFAFALPTLLVTGAAFFAFATVTRSMMWSYVGAIGFIVLDSVAMLTLRDPAYDRLTALLDPFGAAALSLATKYWTSAERNENLPQLAGYLLANRVLWVAVALAIYLAAYRAFRFTMRFERARASERGVADEPAKGSRSRAARAARVHRAELQALAEHNPGAVRGVVAADARRTRAALPEIPARTAASARAQWFALARMDMGFVFRSPAFFVLLGIGLLNSVGGMWLEGDFYGSPSYPVTQLMVSVLEGAYTIFVILIAGFYAGELVWRDRERRMHEIIDAAPVPDWMHVAPKILAIVLVLLATLLVGVLGGLLVQVAKGWLHFEIGGYLLWFVWPWLLTCVMIAVLAVFVQVLVPHKGIGWALMLVYLVSNVTLKNIGFNHHLYRYASASMVPLSDMSGMDRFWIARTWFEVYWLAFAAILVLFSHALWPRGEATLLRVRLRRIGQRMSRPWLAGLAVACVAWLGTGAWIFYNTNVLNRYSSSTARDAHAAAAEKTLLGFEAVPQPRISAVTLAVQLWPGKARAVTTGTYTVVNRTAAPISEIHLQWAERLRLDAVQLAGATVQQAWPQFHYRIYRLATPMQPGETRVLGFTTTLEERGFPNDAPLTGIVSNGSFLNNFDITPFIGFSRLELLKGRSKRREHGLPAELRMPKLEDDSARAHNELRRDSDWVTADITVTTDADQTPIAPGRTVSDSVARIDGVARRTLRFVSDAPINQLFSIQSARYDIKRAVWHAPKHDVDLAVYYERGHEFNVDRMLAAMKASLALFSEKFSPYQFEQARIIEFPYEPFAQSFANTIPYSERIGFIQQLTDPEKIDVATYVTAHEIAHQWWGHQLVPADQQGAPMLTETFAQYSALLVMERMYGRDHVRRFLKYELDRYLGARGADPIEELPLARVEDQSYIYYRKGGLAMYWAKEVLGEEVLDRALQKLLAQYAFKPAPYPNTRDFLALLRAEAGPRHDALLADLFEKITLFDLKASNARARRRGDGHYDLTFDIDAHKAYADGAGRETEATMDELVEIGVFTAEPGRRQFQSSDVLVLEKRRIESGRLHVSLVVEHAPAWVGIDPYNKRIDRNSDDNLTRVTVE
jgi:ABC-2 type transport system permease protein